MGDEIGCAAALWPLAISGAGLVLSVLGSLWLAASPSGPGDGRGRLIRIALTVASAVVVACALVCVVVVFFAVGFFKAFDPFEATSSVGQECGPWILGATLIGFLSVLVAGTGLAARLGRPARETVRSAAPGAVLLSLGLAGVVPALAVACWLGSLGPYPWLGIEGRARVHVGSTLRLVPEVVGAGGPEVWRPLEVTVDAREAGTREVRLAARRFLVEVRRTLEVEVGEDRADPLLPLVVGNRWMYRERAERHDQVLWFLPVNHEYEGPQKDVEVTHEERVGGLGVYWLESRLGEGPPRVDEVYNWNGRVHGLDGEPFVEVLTRAQAEAMDNVAEIPDPGEKGKLCRVGLFPSSLCACLEQPEGRAAIPGPSRCVRMQSSDSDALATLASLALGLATAGLVVVDFDSDVTWELVESSAR